MRSSPFLSAAVVSGALVELGLSIFKGDGGLELSGVSEIFTEECTDKEVETIDPEDDEEDPHQKPELLLGHTVL